MTKSENKSETSVGPSELELLRAEVSDMRAKMQAAAAGQIDEVDHYCGDCGMRVKNADDACQKHPHTPISHGGIDPLTGKRTLLRVG